MRTVRLISLFVTALSLLLLPSCGARPGPQEVEAVEPKPRNAASLAHEILGNAPVGLMVYTDRVRGHAWGSELAGHETVAGALEGTGIDPLVDIERAYLAATGVTDEDRALVVVQHNLEEKRVKTALDRMVARSGPDGRWLDEMSIPAARVSVRGHVRVVAQPERGFVVVVPEPLAMQVVRFAGTGGFPDPEGNEAAVFVAKRPSQALRGRHMPRIPETVREARAVLVPAGDGGIDVSFRGRSDNAAQAAADAVALTREVQRVTSMRISFVRIRLFKAVPFASEGDDVTGQLHLSPQEIRQLLSMGRMMKGRRR